MTVRISGLAKQGVDCLDTHDTRDTGLAGEASGLTRQGVDCLVGVRATRPAQLGEATKTVRLLVHVNAGVEDLVGDFDLAKSGFVDDVRRAGVEDLVGDFDLTKSGFDDEGRRIRSATSNCSG